MNGVCNILRGTRRAPSRPASAGRRATDRPVTVRVPSKPPRGASRGLDTKGRRAAPPFRLRPAPAVPSSPKGGAAG